MNLRDQLRDFPTSSKQDRIDTVFRQQANTTKALRWAILAIIFALISFGINLWGILSNG